MGVPVRHVLEQGPMLRSLGRTALTALTRRTTGRTQPAIPTEWISVDVAPPSAELVRAFVKNVGGEPSSYREELPPHLFPQWALPIASRALAGVPYPLTRVLNAGCRFERRAPLPLGERLQVRARLESIDDDGRRAIMTTRIVTGTARAPDGLVAEVHAYVPLARGPKTAASPERRSPPGVPVAARELAYVRLRAGAGLDFAKLTGDFNPIHWSAAYARAAGFPSPILHGFGTFAIAVEAMVRRLLSGRVGALRSVEARFTKPVVLPACAGIYAAEVRGGAGSLFVGAAPGATAHLVGTFEVQGELER